MIREIVKYSDFAKISKENEFFIWNFVTLTQKGLAIRSIFEKYEYTNPYFELSAPNQLVDFLDTFKNMPYFESKVSESMDFLMNFGFPAQKLWHQGNFNPILLGFRKGILISHTFKHCYCVEGLTELILDLNPNVDLFL